MTVTTLMTALLSLAQALGVVTVIGGTLFAIFRSAVRKSIEGWIDNRFTRSLKDIEHRHNTELATLKHTFDAQLEEFKHEKQTTLEGVRHEIPWRKNEIRGPRAPGADHGLKVARPIRRSDGAVRAELSIIRAIVLAGFGAVLTS